VTRSKRVLAEAIEIAERSGVATEIYHLKAAGPENWPKMATVIERSRRRATAAIDIGADMYPYDGSGTGLAACLPPWASADGKRYENLRDPEMREKILAEMRNPQGHWENLGARSGPEKVLLAEFQKAGAQEVSRAVPRRRRRRDWAGLARGRS